MFGRLPLNGTLGRAADLGQWTKSTSTAMGHSGLGLRWAQFGLKVGAGLCKS